MHQRNSNWMDGVEHVTQCGIPPGASFTYIFNASQYGTHWYHSHSGAQRTDGLFGALIVKEKEQGNAQYTAFLNKLNDMKLEPNKNYFDNPGEHTLTLLDWQKSSSLDLFTQIQSSIRYFNIDKASELQGNRAATGTSSTDGAFIGPVPYWSGLINGRGRNNDTDYSNSILSEFNVTAGNTYRFRLIGAQSLYAYRFSIEDHKLTVIATDGQFIKPVMVDYIIIHSGERYDFLLKTKEVTTIRQFMIRAVTLKFTATSTYLEEQSAEAILNYNSVTTPSSDYAGIAERIKNVSRRCTDECVALNCPFEEFPEAINIVCMHITDLKLLTEYPEDLPTTATDDTTRLFFNFGFEGTRRTSSINGRNLKLPSASLAQLEPNKLTDIENNEYCMHPKNKEPNTNKCDRNNEVEVISPDCHCTHVLPAEEGKSIELVLSATGSKEQRNNYAFAHPIHLHGHYFHVVEIVFGEYDDNGTLIAGNDTIDCGDSYLCVRPRWTKNEFNRRKELGKKSISPTAPLKDTLLIPAGGYAVVYFKTDNPGWWFLHCHIEVHQLEGMGVIIDEGGKKTIPPKGMYKCGNFSLTPNEFKAAINTTERSVDCTQCPESCRKKNDFGDQKRHEICKWYSVGLGISVGLDFEGKYTV
uniref:Plastocyanin-like domain-containing protein n=1 Tax=Amphimedon queenslandica TaxID=400682 RepID=A0A1X7U061_AMPQE